MNVKQLAIVVLCMALLGCAESKVPNKARLVGGGIYIDYEAPTDGTAVLIERNSGRIVATESLAEGSHFEFNPNKQGVPETLSSMFGSELPTNTLFELYFVPTKTNK